MLRIRSLHLVGALGIVIAGALLFHAVAFAGHNEPEEAEEFESALVRAFAECTAPNTTTDNLGLDACTPSVALDTVCAIDPDDGDGEVEAKVREGDVELKVKVEGLTGCDGETLVFVATTRVTTDNCGGSDCTAVDQAIPVGSCVVDKGKCKIKTTVNEDFGIEVFGEGNNAGIEILGCGLVRTTGMGAPAQTLSCGLLVDGGDDDDDDDDDDGDGD